MGTWILFNKNAGSPGMAGVLGARGWARISTAVKVEKPSAAAAATAPTSEHKPKKKKAAPRKASKTKAKAENRKKWPRVKCGDWQYVYISGGPFEGRFGYYDDHESGPLVYFGAPVLGDGPYEIPLRYLRKPPAKYCTNVFVAM
jgi:hypothetical protein